MSKSFKKKKYCKIAGESDKLDKRLANRTLRSRVKGLLKKGRFDKAKILNVRDVSDIWCFNSDGKMYYGDFKIENKRDEQTYRQMNGK